MRNPGPKTYYRYNYHGSFERKVKKLLQLAKDRAKRKNIEFSITEADLVSVTHCPLLGIEISFDNRGSGGKPNSPSIDRINPSKGYVPGNVWVISAKANRIKSDATPDELVLLVTNMLKFIKN